jgi:hypothetical protein
MAREAASTEVAVLRARPHAMAVFAAGVAACVAAAIAAIWLNGVYGDLCAFCASSPRQRLL